MSISGSPLSTITTDTQTLEGHLKTAFGTLSADAKTALTQALADAHQEVVDLKGAGASIWGALLAAIGKAPAPPVATK
jgi:hypothetical protein